MIFFAVTQGGCLKTKMLLEISILLSALIWVFGRQIQEIYLRYWFNSTKHSEFVGYWVVTPLDTNAVASKTIDTDKIPCDAMKSGKSIKFVGYVNNGNYKKIDLTEKYGLSIAIFEENMSGTPYPLVASYDIMPESIKAQMNSGKTVIQSRGWIHNLPHTENNEVQFNIYCKRVGNVRLIEQVEVIMMTDQYNKWRNVKRDYHYISNSVGN